MLGYAVILPVKSLNDKHPIGIAHAAGTLMMTEVAPGVTNHFLTNINYDLQPLKTTHHVF
jgi:hypothetical protein